MHSSLLAYRPMTMMTLRQQVSLLENFSFGLNHFFVNNVFYSHFLIETRFKGFLLLGSTFYTSMELRDGRNTGTVAKPCRPIRPLDMFLILSLRATLSR